MLIINAHILTMEGSVYPDGFLLTEGGRIAAIGPMSQLPAGCEQTNTILDAEKGYLLPGLIDAHTHLGLWEDALGFEGEDGNEETDPSTPQLRALDAVNPTDRCFEDARRAGVTTVVTGPGSANAIGGQLLAMKTFGNRIDDMVIKQPLAIKFAMGENPKTVYHAKNQSPTTRMATASIIREQLFKAKKYAQLTQSALEDEELDEPDYDAKCEALLPLLKKEIPAHFHAHRADDIFTAIRIAREFDLDYVLIHCTEGHLIADQLADEGAKALLGPALLDRSKPELKNLSFVTPARLQESGLLFGIITDHPATPIQYLTLCAAMAVREGLDPDSALRALTINPARICGLDGRVGSLAEGKDADFVLFTAHPLDFETKIKAVFINGKGISESQPGHS